MQAFHVLNKIKRKIVVDWYGNAGKLRTWALLMAIIGKLVSFAANPPYGLAGSLLTVPVHYMIALKILNGAFTGIVLIECVRIILSHWTGSWSLQKHYAIVFLVAAIISVLQITTSIPRTSTDYYSRGWALADKGDYDAAIASLNKAISLDPKHVKSYAERGWVHKKLRDYESSIADYNKAIYLNPKYSRAYIGRGQVHYRKGNFIEALRDWEKAIDIEPSVKPELEAWLKSAREKLNRTSG